MPIKRSNGQCLFRNVTRAFCRQGGILLLLAAEDAQSGGRGCCSTFGVAGTDFSTGGYALNPVPCGRTETSRRRGSGCRCGAASFYSVPMMDLSKVRSYLRLRQMRKGHRLCPCGIGEASGSVDEAFSSICLHGCGCDGKQSCYRQYPSEMFYGNSRPL